MAKRFLTIGRALRHENPLGLPRAGTPPNLAARMRRGLPEQRQIAGVRKVVAISSAKGGVGKSTIAANLAVAFARLGYRSGILDTDIFGPSIPTLFNLTDADEPALSSNNRIIPLTNYGVKTMSMGFLVKPDAAVVWRGLMITKALQQLLHEIDWGGLDILILDLPPGTGDTQLTISQQIKVDGAVLVSTPQQLAIADLLRGLQMFKSVNVPILGFVRNMSVFVCPDCHASHHIFNPRHGTPEDDRNGLEAQCHEHGLEILGDIPIVTSICKDADMGIPSTVAEPNGDAARTFLHIARQISARIDL